MSFLLFLGTMDRFFPIHVVHLCFCLVWLPFACPPFSVSVLWEKLPSSDDSPAPSILFSPKGRGKLLVTHQRASLHSKDLFFSFLYFNFRMDEFRPNTFFLVITLEWLGRFPSVSTFLVECCFSDFSIFKVLKKKKTPYVKVLSVRPSVHRKLLQRLFGEQNFIRSYHIIYHFKDQNE